MSKTSPRKSITSMLYKQYAGQQTVDVSCSINVPGKWFGGTSEGALNAGEKKEKYEAIAVEYEEKHIFEAAAPRRPAQVFPGIRFTCPADAADDPNHAGYWMKLTEWNRFRNDTYKDNRDAELPYLPPTELEAATATLASAPAPSAASAKQSRQPVYEYFECVKIGRHTIQPKDGTEEQTVACQWWQCKKFGKGCKVKPSVPIKVVKSATGGLLKHVCVCEGEEMWLSVRSASKGSRIEKAADGSIITKLSWLDLLPHHVRFVIYCFQTWDHFSKSRSEPFREYISGWEVRSRLPHRNMCVQILFVIQHLVKGKLNNLLAQIKKQVGSPCCGFLDDVWSKRNCKQSFACAHLPLAIDGDLLDAFLQSLTSTLLAPQYRGTILSCSPVLSFSTLGSSRHTGHVLARWKRSVLEGTQVLTIKDISLATEDGASNNKKSNKLLCLPSMVCYPHDLQRCVLFGAGLTGSPCRNVALKAFQARSSKMVGAFSKSGVATADLMEAQELDDDWDKVVSLSSPNATRWLGLARQATRNRELQPNIATALCGAAGGVENESSDEEADSLSDSDSAHSGDEQQEEVSSDDDLIESRTHNNKAFPLAHRLLTNDEFELNRQWESVLVSPAEVSAMLQSHDGMRLEEAHTLMVTLGECMEASRMQVVSGRGDAELWDDFQASHLNQMFKDFRTIFVDEANNRFCLKGTPNSHILLALKMSPFIDTSSDSMFGKKATQELMEATYKTKLCERQIHMLSNNPNRGASTPGAATPGAATPVALTDSCTPAHASPSVGATSARPSSARPSSARPSSAGAGPSSAGGHKKRQKISSLAAVMHSSKKPEVHDSAASMLADEIAAYDKIAATVDHSKYKMQDDSACYDLNHFWADHKKTLPIHYHVYLGDCGSKHASSASVESVYSGATKFSDSADHLNDNVLAAYVFLHYNWQYSFLRPTLEEIVAAYKRMHSAYPPADELSDEEDGEGEAEDGEDADAEGDE